MIYKELTLGNFNKITAEIEQSFGAGYSILIYDEHLYWVELYAMTLKNAEKIAENEFNKCINELKTKGFNENEKSTKNNRNYFIRDYRLFAYSFPWLFARD